MNKIFSRLYKFVPFHISTNSFQFNSKFVNHNLDYYKLNKNIKMYKQTSISQFFKKKSTSNATNDKDKVKESITSDDDDVPKSPTKGKTDIKTTFTPKPSTSKNKNTKTKSTKDIETGVKRKSSIFSESDEDKNSQEKLKKKNGNGNVDKKPRRRIIVESSSSSSSSSSENENENENGTNNNEKEKSNEDEELKSNDSDDTEHEKKLTPDSLNSPSPSPNKNRILLKPTKGKGKVTTKKTIAKKPKPVKEKKLIKIKSKKEKKEDSNSEVGSDLDASITERKTDMKKKSPLAPKINIAPSIKGWNNDYNPMKLKYHPIDDATWERGESVPYLALSKTLEAIEITSSRLKFIEILSNYFRSVIILTPDDLLCSVYLCLNKLAPAYEGIELGIAETNIMKAIAQATGRSLQSIKIDAATHGDLGLVAETSRSNQKTLFQSKPLTVSAVFHKFKEIAALTGHASQGKRINIITSMLVACKYSEAKFLTRSLVGKLRIGLAEQSLLQALANACFLTPPNQDLTNWPPKILNAGKKLSPDGLKAKMDEETFKMKSCYCECPNYDILIKCIIKHGVDKINEYCKLTPGIPPRPMLAQPTKGVADVLERFEGIKFTCEYKYDGERAQIHLLENGTIKIYSRNQEDNTSKYPDIINRFKSCIKGDIKSCIIDSEAVAWDIEKKMILPFQVLSTRKRKDANESEIKVQVQLFVFDLIYLNGETLIKKPFIERRTLLHEHFNTVVGEFEFATNLDTNSMDDVQEFLEESIKGNCEGLMVKTLDINATYELSKRSNKWLKLKKDYLDCGGDSLDLVVIGGFLGRGKRTGTYGGFLLACYDADNEEFQSICKIGTGFTDEDLQQHTENLKPHIIKGAKPYYRFHQQLTPDHWFDAVKVWEVKCADLSLSPTHLAGVGIADPERGISLRFPRFLRIRDDKNVEDATSSQQVADMYNNQEQVKNSTKSSTKNNNDDDDFY